MVESLLFWGEIANKGYGLYVKSSCKQVSRYQYDVNCWQVSGAERPDTVYLYQQAIINIALVKDPS